MEWYFRVKSWAKGILNPLPVPSDPTTDYPDDSICPHWRGGYCQLDRQPCIGYSKCMSLAVY